MTASDYESFEYEVLKYLRKDNKKCLKTIANNNKIVENYLNNGDFTYVRKFVSEFNNVVLDPSVRKYKLFESVLNESSFTHVMSEFRKSDVLINACRYKNKEAAKWLLTMNMDMASKMN